MINSYNYEANIRRMKIIKEYLFLIRRRHKLPKQAYAVVKAKYGCSRKSIYNWLKKFKDLPIK